MSVVIDGTSGVTTPGVVNTAGETIATTLSVTGASTFTGTGKFATTIGVGNATPSASGSGITFPATQSASSDANTLDDYEEGNWTPTQGAGLTVVGTFASSGKYTKIGNVVTIQFTLAATTIACSANGIICGGLPFSDTSLNAASGTDSNNIFFTFLSFTTSLYATPAITARPNLFGYLTYIAA